MKTLYENLIAIIKFLLVLFFLYVVYDSLDYPENFIICMFFSILIITIYCLSRKMDNVKKGIKDEDDWMFKTNRY